jgi:hypothetical protein
VAKVGPPVADKSPVEVSVVPEKPTSPEASVNRRDGGNLGLAVECRIVPEKRLVWVKFRKRVTETEITNYAASLRSSPLFEPQFSEIVDLREVEQFELHGEQMMKLADKVDPFSFDSKRAFIVRDATQSHAARMHQILRTAHQNIRIFHSLEEAEHWMGDHAS